jgi:hypothetical protein
MTVTRTVTNAGDPIVDQTGEFVPDYTVSFQLCNAQGATFDAWDGTSGEKIVSVLKTPTITAGEFSIALWPNDRGVELTYYRCSTSSAADTDRLITVASGAGDLSWKALMLASLPIP